MGNFVTGNTALPAQKTDAYPPTGLATELDAADINSLWSAAGDLRTQVYATTPVVNVKDPQWAGGAKGDNATDDTAAIQAAINSLTAGMVVIPPGSTYIVTSLAMKSGVFIALGGATMKMKAGAAIGARMLDFSGVSRAGLLGSFTLDGNRAAQVNTGNSGQFGVFIGPAASDIYIQSAYATGFAEDGLYIGSAGTTPKGIVIDRWVSDQCFRNGVSITNAQDVHIGYMECRTTSGAAPEAGLDIETNTISDVLANIHIGHLNVHGNNGRGVQFLGVMSGTAWVHGGVTIDRLDAYGNLSGGVLMYKLRRVSIMSGEIYSNTGAGIDVARDITLLYVNSHVHDNTLRGINAALTTQTVASSDWDFSATICRNNSQGVANAQDGIKLDSDDAAKVLTRVRGDGVRLFDDQGVPTQRFGLTTGANTSDIEFSAYMAGNATSSYSLGGTGYVETQRIYSSQVATYTLIAAGASQVQNITVTGAAANDQVLLSPTGMLTGTVFSGFVSGANTVAITIGNMTAGGLTPGAIRFQITVIKH